MLNALTDLLSSINTDVYQCKHRSPMLRNECILSNINTVINPINYVVHIYKVNTKLIMHLQLKVFVTTLYPSMHNVSSTLMHDN